MLQIVYYTRKEQFLSEMETVRQPKVFVTPSPVKADGLRAKLSSQAGDVITIAKFVADLTHELCEEESSIKVKRKAELLLVFGLLKSKYLPELGFEQFKEAYNLFSDLRSFTLNLDTLTSVLEEHSPEIRQAVELFWKLLDLTGFTDEHGAYHQMTEALRSGGESLEKKTIVFWGFQHLNGQQVDLLKALAAYNDVVIPFPLDLKEKLRRTDWVSWLLDDSTIIKELENEIKTSSGNWISVNSRELARHLKEVLSDGDEIVLGVSKLSSHQLDIIPSSKVSYKIPHQLIQMELKTLSEDLRKLASSKTLLMEEFSHYLEERRKSALTPLRQGVPSFKMLKAIQLYQSVLKSIQELTESEVRVDLFFVKLLQEIVELNQPRTSFVPVSSSSLGIALRDMSGLDEVKRGSHVFLCIDERFEEIQGLGQNYPESIQRSLATLGPLKRNELELLFKEWEFKDLFSSCQVTVLMSESTLKHSLIWKRLFSGIELHPIKTGSFLTRPPIRDHFTAEALKVFSDRYSASKFQTFLDCPRKFYFSYVEKIFPSLALEKDLDPMARGTLTHKIIEEFFKRGLSETALPRLTSEILDAHIKERNLSLPREVYLQRELTFNHRALNGVVFLRQLERITRENIQWKLETEFSLEQEYKLSGKIDCIGESEKYIFLLDFKSTKYSASSSKEVEELESIQLWAYAQGASGVVKDFKNKSVVLGFVVLDNPAESNLLLSDETLSLRFKEERLFKFKKLKDDFNDVFEKAREKMVSLAQEIRTEKVFAAKPRKSGVCHFCDMNRVCIKSEAEDV